MNDSISSKSEEIRFTLKQLGAYFSIKIRDKKEGDVPVELLQHVKEIQEYVDNLPSAGPELKYGKWIPVTNSRGGHECSLCQSYAPSFKTGDEWLTDYCPSCGAKMDEVRENDH